MRLIGKFDAKRFVERGFGVALVYCGDFEPDFDHGRKYGVRSVFGADGIGRLLGFSANRLQPLKTFE